MYGSQLVDLFFHRSKAKVFIVGRILNQRALKTSYTACMEMEHAEVPQMHLMQLAMPSGSRLMIPFSWCPAKICLAQRAQLRGPCSCIHTYLISYTVYTAYIVFTAYIHHKVNTVCRIGIQMLQKKCGKEITFQKTMFLVSWNGFTSFCQMKQKSYGSPMLAPCQRMQLG